MSVPASTGVSGADGIREAVSAQSHAVGGMVEALDSLAIEVGGSRISVWDASVVVMVITAVILFA